MAVTGSGTYLSPWSVETLTELIEYTGSSHADEYVEIKPYLEKTSDTRIIPNKLYFLQDGSYVNSPTAENLGSYYENTLIFDFRDIGDNINWVIYSHQIQFNGAKLRNIVCNDGNAITFNGSYCEGIYNAYFENFDIKSSSSFIVSNDVSRTIYRCLFTGVTSSLSEVIKCSNGIYINKSSFDIEFANSNSFMQYTSSYYPEFENCKIKTKGTITPIGDLAYFVHGNTSSGNGHIRLTNCFLDGVFPGTRISLTNTNNKQCTNSIINMDFKATDNISASSVSGSYLVNILVNSTKANGATIHQRYTQVTDEQLKDISYLQSIGFPIIGE